MNQKVHMLAFFQGWLKTGHQLCRQILDKANCICQSYLEIVPQMDTLSCRVQSRKELVSFILCLTGQSVHDGWFPSIGVTNQTNLKGAWLQTFFSDQSPDFLNHLELALDIRNLVANATTVQLQLAFTRSTGTNSPAWRLSIIPWPTKRGKRYLSWARWTWSFPSWLRARMAKISKINCIRSMTLTPRTSSKLTFCLGVRRLLTMTVVISSASNYERNFFLAYQSRRRSWNHIFHVFSVAIYKQLPQLVLARLANSSMERSKLSIPCNSTPMSRTRSLFFSVSII